MQHEHEYGESILRDWTDLEARMPSARQSDDFRRFLDWCRFYGVDMPADAEDVAHYLLELMTDGASLPAIKRAAKSIITHYELRRCPLTRAPIRAALAMCAAQLDHTRTIN
jgi:hypothetical protein